MYSYRTTTLHLLCAIYLVFVAACASEPNRRAADTSINLLPKYGLVEKNAAQKAADAELLAAVDEDYDDRGQAAEHAANRGWEFLRQGKPNEAMRRFNQAWLIDPTNGNSIWGMAAIESNAGKVESLQLFAEAEGLLGDDLDLDVDHARAIGMIGFRTRNKELLQDAFARYSSLYERAPEHTLNLQNWAIALYLVGDYAQAWQKIELAEATPTHAEIDPNFVRDLERKAPRP